MVVVSPSMVKTPLHETLKPGDLRMVVGLLAVFYRCERDGDKFFLILFGGNEKSCNFAASNLVRSGSLRVRLRFFVFKGNRMS